ncbi:MAG TPA: NPCBM/NEW2 domain-containing protein [Vicinamibacterales bacterium]|nr:NPCBM/NEW2 domain-containing protein [Vicinamibacterales bacterium]
MHPFRLIPLAGLTIALATFGGESRTQDAAVLQGADPPPNGIWLDRLDLSKVQLRPQPRPGRGQTTAPPMVFKLGGVTYPHAVPLRSDADMTVDLGGTATRFMSMIGVDDGAPPPAPQPGAPPPAPTAAGSVVFGVWVDGKKVFESDVMKRGDAPKLVSVDLTGAKRLVLAVIDANDGVAGDNADWAGAVIVNNAGQPSQTRVVPPVAETAPQIAPSRTAAPMINYPRITGATPGRPFLFRIPASGDGPLTFTARNLPAGLALDAKSGIITGSLKQAGRTDVQVGVKNPKGQMSNAVITIVGGDHMLALTPPLGWNSWNVWGGIVKEEHVRAAADGMVRTGLAGQGYTYINIDDAWEGGWRKGPNGRHDVAAGRDANGEIITNEKFPDMKGLVDYIHSKGLKAGIYSGPGPTTCQGLVASYQHEDQDARTWAKWGFDYLKYDWCSYTQIEPLAARAPLDALEKPYQVMRAALDKLDRDVVFSLCQYGWGNVWEWGGKVGGNLWRVTGDINDNWWSMSSIAFQQTGHEAYAGPGRWNDTDMLVVGHLGWGRTDNPRPTLLTPNEQLTHISLWALQAAPMLIGADMSQIDDWTVDLLGNREVLAINQDPMGKAAGRVWADNWTQVWARPLSDGTMAVGLFNRAPEPAPVTVKFSDIGLTGPQPIHYPWTHTDQGGTSSGTNTFTATVPRHGVVLLKVGKPKTS